jgi:hypothetical protein
MKRPSVDVSPLLHFPGRGSILYLGTCSTSFWLFSFAWRSCSVGLRFPIAEMNMLAGNWSIVGPALSLFICDCQGIRYMVYGGI